MSCDPESTFQNGLNAICPTFGQWPTNGWDKRGQISPERTGLGEANFSKTSVHSTRLHSEVICKQVGSDLLINTDIFFFSDWFSRTKLIMENRASLLTLLSTTT